MSYHIDNFRINLKSDSFQITDISTNKKYEYLFEENRVPTCYTYEEIYEFLDSKLIKNQILFKPVSDINLGDIIECIIIHQRGIFFYFTIIANEIIDDNKYSTNNLLKIIHDQEKEIADLKSKLDAISKILIN
jgi:hypothetical protein